MNIYWVSANLFGLELLKHVIGEIRLPIRGIITLPRGSKVVMYDGVPSRCWRVFDVPVYETQDINEEAEFLKTGGADLLIVCGWRQVIKSDILKIPCLGTIGFHPTLLPEGRGAAPIINTLLAGKSRSGVSLFQMAEGIDDGDIIGQEAFPIDVSDHADDLYTKIVASGKRLLDKYLLKILAGSAPRIPQVGEKATYYPKPKLANNRINLDQDSPEQVFRKIKALSKPYRGAYIVKDGKKIILWRAELTQ